MLGLSIPDIAMRRRGLDPAALALIARMSPAPEAARARVIDQLVRSLKLAGVWTKIDALYLLAAHGAQPARLNWVSGDYALSVAGSPLFTVDRGYTGDGVSSYLDSGFNAAIAGGRFSQNDAHMGVWVGTDVADNGQFDIGTTRSGINARRAAVPAARLLANAGAADELTISPASAVGWLFWSRGGSASYSAAKNGGGQTTIGQASQPLLSTPFYLLAHSTAGPVATGLSTRRVQAACWGGQLSGGEAAALYGALASYLTAVGAA